MYILVIIIYWNFFLRKNEAKGQCDDIEDRQFELINHIKVLDNSRQPYFTKKTEIHGKIIKFNNKKNAFDKMEKDIQFAQSELKREEERSNVLLKNHSVCL